jgi:hypothetical protein
MTGEFASAVCDGCCKPALLCERDGEWLCGACLPGPERSRFTPSHLPPPPRVPSDMRMTVRPGARL